MTTVLKKFGLLFVSLILAAIWTFASLRPNYSSIPALDLWMLDIGQGESVLLREPTGKKILFDGGPNDAVLSQLGQVLPPWDRIIDLMIISHNHSDHIRGLIPVIERFSVKEIWLSGAIHTTDEYRALLEAIQSRRIKVKIVYFQPDQCQVVCPPLEKVGEAGLQVYHPLINFTGVRPEDQHDATVAMKISFGNQSVFLPGDIEERHEKILLAACLPPLCSLKADILQVPHHGSASGLYPAFLSAVSPKAALIPVGADNPYGHPRKATLERLAAAQIPTYRTDLDGRLRITIFSDSFQISTSR